MYAQCACVVFVGKMADPMYVHQGKECSISAMEQFQRERHKLPSLPAEYVAAFSRQTEATQVRCDLTDTHTDRHGNYRNPRCACQHVHYSQHVPGNDVLMYPFMPCSFHKHTKWILVSCMLSRSRVKSGASYYLCKRST